VSFALAGCSGSGDTDADGGGDRTVLDDFSYDYTIEEDAYKGFSFEVEQESTVEWDAIVRSEYAVDVIVMERGELDAYEARDRFEYVTSASRLDTVGDEVSVTIAAGEYALVVDNSDVGEAEPPTNFDDDLAEVEIEGGLYA
jgi:hypothetical protein